MNQSVCRSVNDAIFEFADNRKC